MISATYTRAFLYPGIDMKFDATKNDLVVLLTICYVYSMNNEMLAM